MAMTIQIPELVTQKLAAFGRIQAEYEECFHFIQDMHGQKRLASCSVEQVVYYLHALWLCECKDRLLSIYENIRRYEGQCCLELLRLWQAGQSTQVVAFLTAKLNILSFTGITRQLEQAQRRPDNQTMVRRLEHGRIILLNRGLNFFSALDALFCLSAAEQLQQVRVACQQYNHLPVQIEAQLAELETPLYTYRPHQLLAQQNMVVMNRLNVDVLEQSANMLAERFWQISPPDKPLAPFAEQVIQGYLEQYAPVYNNRRGVRFVDRVELERDGHI